MIIAALSSVNLKEITADSDGFIRLSYFGRYATLARALLKDASVLLPDEASSALDVGSESTVLESGAIAETAPPYAKLKHAGRLSQKLLSVKTSLKTLSDLF
ncbi:hypothetical protein GWP40_04450 [Treponema vincentii]|uniref:hypothetical protein n=1 Tax=Treponema TaxID=157 RepID=UPI001BB0B83A|nr:hypothetical protein [Treponema vincentii]QUY17686.1 hypothetical protein GWP40_04450 [Treponema vincentii]